jgi:hypothetical protein
MLQPFDFAIINIDEAKLLLDFIRKQTATKHIDKNYEKMQKLGVLEIHSMLESFVYNHAHYEKIKNFDPYDPHHYD